MGKGYVEDGEDTEMGNLREIVERSLWQQVWVPQIISRLVCLDIIWVRRRLVRTKVRKLIRVWVQAERLFKRGGVVVEAK